MEFELFIAYRQRIICSDEEGNITAIEPGLFASVGKHEHDSLMMVLESWLSDGDVMGLRIDRL